MDNKVKKRVTYVLCAVLTVAVTVAAMFLPQALSLINDGKEDSGSVTETFNLNGDTTGITAAEFVTLVNDTETVWVPTGISQNTEIYGNETDYPYATLTDAVSDLGESLKSYSDGNEAIEKEAAFILNVSEHIKGCAQDTQPEMAFFDYYKMKGTLNGKSVENDFISASLTLRYAESETEPTVEESGSILSGCGDEINILYDINSDKIFEFYANRYAENDILYGEYISEYYTISDTSDDAILLSAVENYWQFEGDNASIGSADASSGGGFITVSIYANQLPVSIPVSSISYY